MSPSLDVVQPLISFQQRIHALFVTIETQRLLICSYQDDDFKNCMQLYGNRKITKYFDHGEPYAKEQVENIIYEKGKKHFRKGRPFGLFSIFHKTTKLFLGQIDLLPADESQTAEIGFIFQEQYQNQGYCTEAVKAVLHIYIKEINRNFFFEGLPINKVIATVHPDNGSSKKVLEKLGMTQDKIEERFGKPRLWYKFLI